MKVLCRFCSTPLATHYASGAAKKNRIYCSSTCAGRDASKKAVVDDWRPDTTERLEVCLDAAHLARLDEVRRAKTFAGPHGGRVFDDTAERELRGVSVESIAQVDAALERLGCRRGRA